MSPKHHCGCWSCGTCTHWGSELFPQDVLEPLHKYIHTYIRHRPLLAFQILESQLYLRETISIFATSASTWSRQYVLKSIPAVLPNPPGPGSTCERAFLSWWSPGAVLVVSRWSVDGALLVSCWSPGAPLSSSWSPGVVVVTCRPAGCILTVSWSWSLLSWSQCSSWVIAWHKWRMNTYGD